MTLFQKSVGELCAGENADNQHNEGLELRGITDSLECFDAVSLGCSLRKIIRSGEAAGGGG